MKIPDPIVIGYPAPDEPTVIGTLSGHGLPDDLLIGTPVSVHGKMHIVNVSYIPANPKRERLLVLLEPKERLAIAKPAPAKQEEFPF